MPHAENFDEARDFGKRVPACLSRYLLSREVAVQMSVDCAGYMGFQVVALAPRRIVQGKPAIYDRPVAAVQMGKQIGGRYQSGERHLPSIH